MTAGVLSELRPKSPQALLRVVRRLAVALHGGDDSLPSFSDPTGVDNPYSPLTEFRRCELRGEDGGARVNVVRTLLDRTEPFTSPGRPWRSR